NAEERTLSQMSGPGRIVVVAAGNEREDDGHLGGRFIVNQTETVIFDVAQRDKPAGLMTIWYDKSDKFDITFRAPSGRTSAVPATGNVSASADGAQIELSRNVSVGSSTVQVQIFMQFPSSTSMFVELNGWRLIL